MQRRHALFLPLLPMASLALSACGFKLRQAPKFSFTSVQLTATTPIAQALQRSLIASGLRVLDALPPAPRPAANSATPPPASERADVVLQVLQDQTERAVVGQTTSGQVRELELRTRFRFRLSTPLGREIIASTELLQTRDQSFSETLVLGKEAEETLLYKDMQTDVVEQVMRLLAAVRL